MLTRARITLCLAAILLAGCDMPSFAGLDCIAFEPGDCGTPVGTPGPSVFILGFPAAKLDSSAVPTGGTVRGLLRVGDTVTFHVVSESNFPNDTVRYVTWSTDTSTARMVVHPDGGMTLTATAIGLVTISTNYYAAEISCETVAGVLSCTPIGEIDVIPKAVTS